MAGGTKDSTADVRGSRRSLLETVAGVGAVGFAGCLSGGADGEGVVVGATIPETGRLSGLGQELREGYQLGVDHINDGDEFDGEIELKLADDESDPEKVGQRLRRLITDEGVTMAWGSITTPLVMAGSAVAEHEGLPFLGAMFSYERPHHEKDLSWTFVPYPKTTDIVEASVAVVETIPAAERPSRVGIWEPNSGWGKEMADGWESAFSGAGYDVVFRETFGFETRDFSSLITKSDDRDVQILVSNPLPPDGITAMKQMKENGFAPELIAFVRAAHSNGWWKSLGADGSYTLTCPGWVPGLSGNGNERFREDDEAEFDDDDLTIPTSVGGAYNLTQVAAQVLSVADSTAPDDIRSTILDETFGTVIGEFGFEANGLLTGDLQAPVGQWWEGAQRLIYPDSDHELAMNLQYPMEDWDQR